MINGNRRLHDRIHLGRTKQPYSFIIPIKEAASPQSVVLAASFFIPVLRLTASAKSTEAR
jgi:hypothetical protein